MSATKRPRFDLDALRERAGAKTFARGEAYHRDGRVEILILEPQRVLAQVAGAGDYRTTVTGRGRAFGGECDCPAFAESGFCKHMIAVALAVNAAGEDGSEGVAMLARIRRHLKAKGVDALVKLVLELAEQDRDLLRRLELASATVEVTVRRVTVTGLR